MQKHILSLRRLHLTAVLMAAVSFTTFSNAAEKEVYPSKPLTIVVPSPAGNVNDAVARLIGQELTKTWNQPVVVENRLGAGGNIGVEAVVKAKPDGYTLLIGTVGIHAINGALYEKMSFHPIHDFTPISFLASTPNVLVVSKQLNVKNVHELIELAKAKLGWQPKVNLEDGLKETIAYFRKVVA